MLSLLRYSLRQVRRAPGFAITALVILGLGLGATIAIFSVLNAVLLKPLPFPSPDRLVAIAAIPDDFVSMPTVHDWQERSHTFASIAAYRGWAPTVKTASGTESGRVLEISRNFFLTLGASFALGQDFAQGGNERECNGEAIVSQQFWQHLGGGSALAGRTLEINRRTFLITGVLPASQTIEGGSLLDQPDIFVELACDNWQRLDKRGWNSWQSLGRMKPGVSIGQATADLGRVQATLARDYPDFYNGIQRRGPQLVPWITQLTGARAQSGLWMTLAACAVLLLIACANLANLMLARNLRRRQEFATRASLGASLGDLLKQLLTESIVLVVCGSALGVGIAAGSLRLLIQVKALHLPRLAHAAIDGRVLIFTAVVTAAVVLVLTVLPALRILRTDLIQDLHGGGRLSSSTSMRIVGRVLVTAQIAFAFLLISAAGWMVASVWSLLHQPLGFNPEHLLMAGVDIDATSVTPRYDAAQTTAFFEAMETRLRALPGVKAVAGVTHPPLVHYINRSAFTSDAHPEQWKRPIAPSPDSHHVTPGYFATVGQALISGRDFTTFDRGEEHVAIVNRALAEREWPGQSAVGHFIRTGELQSSDGPVWVRVIGVVDNVHSFDLESAPTPDLYLPYADHPMTALTFMIRTAGDPSALEHAVRRAILDGHADLAIFRLRSFPQEIESQIALRRFLMQVAAVFAGIALLISVVGTYGLIAYEVSVREKEIGIRLALGSSREGIVRLLLSQEGRWVALGGLLGSAFALGLGYGMRSFFYHPELATGPVFAVGLSLLIAPACLAIALPARRAAALDPVEALRRE